MTTLTTRQQRMAETAFGAVEKREPSGNKEYCSFAKSFPALIQAAGVCQAIAFAQAKGRPAEVGGREKAPLMVACDVLKTMALPSNPALDKFAATVRTANVMEYMRLTRLALQAATWVKRYTEALEKTATPNDEKLTSAKQNADKATTDGGEHG